MKYARWTRKKVPFATQRTERFLLRAGHKGTGQILGSVACWPDSAKSMEATARICTSIECSVQAQGYKILSEDGVSYTP